MRCCRPCCTPTRPGCRSSRPAGELLGLPPFRALAAIEGTGAEEFAAADAASEAASTR